MFGRKACRRQGIASDVGKVVLRELLRRFPELQKPRHGAAAEDIARTGGVDRMDGRGQARGRAPASFLTGSRPVRA